MWVSSPFFWINLLTKVTHLAEKISNLSWEFDPTAPLQRGFSVLLHNRYRERSSDRIFTTPNKKIKIVALEPNSVGYVGGKKWIDSHLGLTLNIDS